MTTTQAIREEIDNISPGEIFTNSAFLKFGSRTAVDQVLSREARAGVIERITRGVYMRPKPNPRLGILSMPSAEEVARKIVEEEGAVLQVHGAEAARRLGLSTQMQTGYVFLTNGARHRFRLGKATITIKPVAPKKLALAGRPAGLAHIALLYLGEERVDEHVLTIVKKRLPEKEFEALLNARALMPGWLSDALRKFRNEDEVVP